MTFFQRNKKILKSVQKCIASQTAKVMLSKEECNSSHHNIWLPNKLQRDRWMGGRMDRQTDGQMDRDRVMCVYNLIFIWKLYYYTSINSMM